jgi:hypothetical protein
VPDPCRVDGLNPCPGGPCPCREPALPPPLICQGRPWTPDGQPAGDVCGKRFEARTRTWVAGDGDARYQAWGVRPETTGEHTDRALAAGWLTDPIPTCPACRRPDRRPIDITQYQERT